MMLSVCCLIETPALGGHGGVLRLATDKIAKLLGTMDNTTDQDSVSDSHRLLDTAV